MKVAIVGATGLVGRKMLQVLEERALPVRELIPVGSSRSVGSSVAFRGEQKTVVAIADALAASPHIVLFSAGGSVSKEFARPFAHGGAYVIDNSSAWRMDPQVPLVVPEVNPHALNSQARIIANPNCSTIQLVVALAPIHRKWGLHRLVISTYQSITGTGKAAVDQYQHELQGGTELTVYPHPIFENCLPHCDVFRENGYTREEIKLVRETRKILEDSTLAITATAVRVPVMGGHSEAVNLELRDEAQLGELRAELNQSSGLCIIDSPAENRYPMPLEAHDRDEVFVGRLRVDESQPNTFNMWIVSDNLRKGAATNAVQIAQALLDRGLV